MIAHGIAFIGIMSLQLSTPHPVDTAAPRAFASAADRIGATASFLCALHCAALPFVLTVLPVLGLGFLANHEFERWFIAFATTLALTMLVRGFRRHRGPQALALLVPSLALLWLGGFVVHAEGFVAWHAVLVALGGSGVAIAHVVNLRLSHAHDACCGPAAIV